MCSNSSEVNDLRWRKARRSAGNGECVEVAPANRQILIRDSKVQDSPVIQYPERSWRAFLVEVKIGQFNPERG
jgi:hypothetical protein